ncbi:MAG TPA: mitochondrial fission ELM1 family protein [Caulobacteraceae bacterium]|nr:mitochondrial fission ELM1 family protein [Caulobacteraceae bacterium]
MSQTQPLTIWAVSDGRAGIEAQAVGMAEALARRRKGAVVEVKRIAWKEKTGRLPWWLVPSARRWLTPESAIAAPWPDIYVAAGRATLPVSMRIRRWSRKQTFVVQLQDPRTPLSFYDVVVPPLHDRVTGENVVSIIGSPHRVTPQRLNKELRRFAKRIDPLPRPRVAVLVGGRSKGFDLPKARAEQMAREIRLAVEHEGGSLLMTFSRRTPDAAKAILTEGLGDLPGVIWDGTGENPYFAFLAAADYILVTEDSTNMATEAAATGKPVFVLKMEGSSLKFRLLHEQLERHGAARPFGGGFHRWTYQPLQETDRAAQEILRRFDAARTR